ncbi:S-layer homology domain-containing protein [Paenisporosarcina sp. OV554]|uniref:S-layer homology domain-containing protein n=1 Tax=Paenisporosarcina sp. OV554 TaxID=2135694 RepID=UPI000D353D56|nr:S-layer homology domain-containing protein [Paenisporosarcina sp. OV554]PUB12927.1 S-layer family protein [Paenisporosarcina sp. OV554]
MTRAEFTVLLVRALQLSVEEYKGTFKDVPATKKWAAQQIEAAHRAAIVFGKNGGSFDADANITREQMAAMMMRSVALSNPDILNGLPNNKKYKDESKINDYAKQSIMNANELGLMYGRSNGKFDPKQPTTRAETAVVLYRMLEKFDSIK